jgi:hypothetical protein
MTLGTEKEEQNPLSRSRSRSRMLSQFRYPHVESGAYIPLTAVNRLLKMIGLVLMKLKGSHWLATFTHVLCVQQRACGAKFSIP